MNQSFLLLAAGLTGLTGGLLGQMLLSDPAPAPASPAPPAVLAGEDRELLQDLASRLSVVEGDLAAVSQRLAEGVASGRTALPDPTSVPAGLSPDEADAWQRAAVAAEWLSQEDFQAAVAQAILEKEKQEEAEREAARLERRQRQHEQRMARLTEELALAPEQAEQVSDILWEADQKRDRVFREMRETGGWADRETLRATFTELNEERNARLSEVLTPEQMQQYEESSRDRWGGGRAQGPGGRGPGRG